MASGLEIFSAIAGCVALAIAVHGFFQDQLQDQEADSVILSIRNDIAILHDFARIFDSAAKDDRILISDKLLLNEICLTLQPLLVSIQNWIVRRQMAHLTASPTRKVADKILGFLYKQAELQKVAMQLFQWTERYHIRLGLLPPPLKDRLLTSSDGVDSLSSSGLRVLRDTFAKLTMQSQYIPDTGLRKAEREVVLRSGPSASRMFATLGQETILVEFKPHKSTLAGQELSIFESEVTKLVKLLSCAEAPLCRILRAAGYFHQSSRSCFAYLYQFPKNVSVSADAISPCTLLDLICTTRPSPRTGSSQTELLPPQHALEERFEFARKIACAVMYVHMMQYVHKSIRTSNIVVLSQKAAATTPETGCFPERLGEPFLCGFETARQDKATSDQRGDAHWRYNIYRHPKRQGLHPQERYTMNHDIYSLGVVLLELGVWRPLLSTGLAKLKDSTDEEVAAAKVKDYLKKMAKERLPIVMGTKYCETVLFCLDVEGDGQIGSSTVIEEVLRKLEELAVGMQ
ncbi:hypothetical protein EPUS_09187 [Endocarpon pusillum Z07020]|uniref:Protein kinase domain-containing protein n=1 Tax=Endocarpon pusillum (strain Z07020 / HMAS-L-300199) TaxID=1263415 RepID=U1GLL2_ENDPU|nr:uncharacterized protein EPUS_09187 [Endocarpon pusillum Z07020]ERF73113.1 hypothetical protein EPUS_09187 [Endocarpon pusillum Z07020]